VHFVALGAALFLAFEWWGSGGAGSSRIVITPGQIEAMSVQFARTWQRPPTEEERKGLIDDYVREEIATREAMAMGLDRDDTIIRRRLRQKLEFLAEDAIEATPPTDADLETWLDTHPDEYRKESEVAFRQVYLSPDRRGANVKRDAQALLARLSEAAEAGDANLGDPLMLPAEVPRSTRFEIARQFGDEFADAIVALEPGRWAGPVTSGYGVHLVYVRERAAAAAPPLAEVRSHVERDFVSDRRRRELASMYERLLSTYRVTIEKPEAAQP
jgi:hypothetical protein